MTRLLAVVIWSLLISVLVSYVLTSMAGTPFNMNHTLILGLFFTVAIFLIGDVALKEEN